MKRLLRSFAVGCCLLAMIRSGYAQQISEPCPTQGTYIEPTPPSIATCYGDIDRYLSRAVFAVGLSDLLIEDKKEYGTHADYCAFIETCVYLKVSFLSRATFMWDIESRMIPGSAFYNAAKKTVIDLEQAYAAAGLSAPILEAAILENVTYDVREVPIPEYVLQAFQDEDGFAGNYLPTTNYHFKQENICTDPLVPDVTRIEARMWMYYLATQYLSMGYRSLHMGNYSIIASRDAQEAVPYRYTYQLFSKIRAFAAQQKNGFVLLNADLHDIYYNNDGKTLLFDFNTSPIRPWETLNNLAYEGTPCHGNQVAEIFGPALNGGELKSKGGISPSGCLYDHTPTLFNLDWAMCDEPNGVPYFYSHYPNYRPWGYDEASWFDQLTDSCQAYWLHNAAMAIKNKVGHRLYLKMPGLNAMTCSKRGPPDNSIYKLARKPTVLSTLHDKTWKPNPWVDFTISSFAEQDKMHTPEGLTYLLQVTEPDATTVYTWHLQTPDGSWLPYSFGATRRITGLAKGEYKAFLIATNFGYPSDTGSNSGKEQVKRVKHFYVTEGINQLNGNEGTSPKSDSTCCYGK